MFTIARFTREKQVCLGRWKEIAVLVKQRSTGKLGIAIIHGLANKVTILGAGTLIGNGDDDFQWMDNWQIYTKDAGAKATGAQSPHTFAETHFL